MATVVLGLLAGFGAGQTAVARAPDLAAALDRVVRRLESHPHLKGKGARFGVLVYDMDRRKVLHQHRADQAFVPASNMKLITTAAALTLLGPDYRWQTRAYALGPVRGGVLEGDLLVVGGGDPGWCEGLTGGLDKIPASLARALRLQRIKRITGTLRVDGRRFDNRFVHPDWPAGQLQSYYCAPVGGLNLEEGCVRVVVEGSRRRDRVPRVTLLPAPSPFTLINRALTAGKGKAFLTVARKDPWRITVGRRSGRSRQEFRVAVVDPVAYAGRWLALELKRRGLLERAAAVPPTAPAPEKGELWSWHTSLGPVLHRVNKESHNMMAEHLFKTLGREKGGEGSFAAAGRVVGRWLTRMGLPARSFTLRDGSGLSKKNRLTPRVLVGVLSVLRRTPAYALFRKSLPVGGVDGTLRRRQHDPLLKGRVQAKTGWVRGASSLSGYLTAGGRTCAFSLLIAYPPAVGGFNRYCKAAQDEILQLLARHLEAGKRG